MNAVKAFLATGLLVLVAAGASTYSPAASAMQATTCSKVQACAGGSCSVYIVCDDGTMYVVV